jgi:hypothetical protein
LGDVLDSLKAEDHVSATAQRNQVPHAKRHANGDAKAVPRERNRRLIDVDAQRDGHVHGVGEDGRPIPGPAGRVEDDAMGQKVLQQIARPLVPRDVFSQDPALDRHRVGDATLTRPGENGGKGSFGFG